MQGERIHKEDMIEIPKALVWVLGIFATSGLLADIAIIIAFLIVRSGGEFYMRYNNESEERQQDSHN